MEFLFLVFIVSCISAIASSQQRVAGHMKPLGAHMEPLSIDSTTGFVDPINFYDSYVSKNKPLLFKGLISNTDTFKKWQSDQYLKKKFGKIVVSLENGKKENRSGTAGMMPFGEFIDIYQERDVYVVHDLPEEMKKEWPFPSFLRCGGYTSNIAYINMWFSSGGTKSVLHSDSFENLHCVVSGTKVFTMIEPKYSRDIGPEHESSGYYMIDVDAVDMRKYSGLSKVPWYNVAVENGDCLYLAYNWLHQVNSYDRNLGVNVWWLPFDFSRDDCTKNPPHGDFATISEFGIAPELAIRNFFLENIRPDDTVHASDIYKAMKERSPDHLTEDTFKKLFDILLPGCGGILTKQDLESGKIKLKNYKKAMEFAEGQLNKADPYSNDEYYDYDDDEYYDDYYDAGPGDDIYYNDQWEDEDWGGGDGHNRDEL